jgi:hypothetical protein
VRLLRTHARRRLVEQEHLRIRGQDGGDLDPFRSPRPRASAKASALDRNRRSATTEVRLPSMPEMAE